MIRIFPSVCQDDREIGLGAQAMLGLLNLVLEKKMARWKVLAINLDAADRLLGNPQAFVESLGVALRQQGDDKIEFTVAGFCPAMISLETKEGLGAGIYEQSNSSAAEILERSRVSINSRSAHSPRLSDITRGPTARAGR